MYTFNKGSDYHARFLSLYDEMSKRGYEKKFVLPVSRWNDFYNTYIFKTFATSKRFKR